MLTEQLRKGILNSFFGLIRPVKKGGSGVDDDKIPESLLLPNELLRLFTLSRFSSYLNPDTRPTLLRAFTHGHFYCIL
uniref:Uncharacterized protein n=1 Tax=Utricularia reniformis TaxID=192314 RepID=A0A1Y0B2D4_9LAMI|nr:hypothetical protein AEK19_MT1335 [Utricularia reniformis]ART31533.1 hypothetical protein AEK19_MT1335 [Utricularia reniformis]